MIQFGVNDASLVGVKFSSASHALERVSQRGWHATTGACDLRFHRLKAKFSNRREVWNGSFSRVSKPLFLTEDIERRKSEQTQLLCVDESDLRIALLTKCTALQH